MSEPITRRTRPGTDPGSADASALPEDTDVSGPRCPRLGRVLSDLELMLQVRESDAAAFERLLERHRQPLTGFFRKLCRDADLAEDLFQETFLRIWTARERYEPTGKFASYLYTVARNVWGHEKERRSRRPVEADSEASGNPGRPSALEIARADENQLPEAVLEARERRRQVDRCLDRLDERLQLVFVLSHFGGLKYADIGRQLHIPVGTVKYRMFQAVRELRRMLEEEGF